MKANKIFIRDPYVLLHQDRYYMYGTRSQTCWGKADGFDCYVSGDLLEWEGPFEIFKRPEGFWADRNFWAPECIYHNDSFYLITTLGGEKRKGIQILKAATPLGPFVPVTEGVVTPPSWKCIDGTVFTSDEAVYLIFSHSFEDVPEGAMCVMELSGDLKAAKTEPVTLFTAKEAVWTCPVPFAKAEFNIDGDVYFSDGPFVHRLKNGQLIMLWSSWGSNGYTVGSSVSESGNIHGPWRHNDKAVLDKGNAGHGMLFRVKDGELRYALHSPNEKCIENPLFLNVIEKEDTLSLKKL